MRARPAGVLGLLFGLLCGAGVRAAEHHVSDLGAALKHPGVKPGDTVWVAGGTYKGDFVSTLNGTPDAPIIIRAAKGQRVTIDGLLSANGSYTWFWGFEITTSDTRRSTSQSGSWPNTVLTGGVATANGGAGGTGCKFINLVVHDVRQGFSTWMGSQSTEIYGCLVYYVGWDAPDRGHGHAIYTQNSPPGTKKIIDNFLFKGHSYGVHAYTEKGALDNHHVEGNTCFDTGELAKSGGRANIYIGKGSGHVLVDNVSRHPLESNALNNHIRGQYKENKNNYIVGGSDGLKSGSGVKVFVRPNRYEPGRSNVTIVNWDLKDSVDVDLSGTKLMSGQNYEVRDAMNFYGPPVKSGTYSGGSISIPMKGLTCAKPNGNVTVQPKHPAPQFGAFVVMPGGGGSPIAAASGDGAAGEGEYVGSDEPASGTAVGSVALSREAGTPGDMRFVVVLQVGKGERRAYCVSERSPALFDAAKQYKSGDILMIDYKIADQRRWARRFEKVGETAPAK